MATEHEREHFNNPLILYSEHKRVLGDAIKRGDERVREAERRGFWQGIAGTIWITGIAGYVVALAAFNFGVRVTS